jgi:hypothetical protein
MGYTIIMADRKRLQAVAETQAFSADIAALMSETDRNAVITAIALAPDSVDLIPGTGGLRKRRIPLPGRGKRGGARVITLYLGEDYPVYALFVFAKNEREDLSAEQTRTLLRLVADIKRHARTRTRR